MTGSFNIVSNNNISNWGYGIEVNGNSNIITNNKFTGDKDSGSEGIVITKGSYNNLSYNTIKNNYFTGLWIFRGSNNTIYKNNFIENGVGLCIGVGLVVYGKLYDSGNNTIIQNNFLNNTKQTKVDYLPDFVNYWNNDEEGNYWSNYNGTDLENNVIGDSPYIINENNQDNYPLIEIIDFSSSSPTPLPGVATFLTTLVVALMVIIGAGLGIIVYFKKYRKEKLR